MLSLCGLPLPFLSSGPQEPPPIPLPLDRPFPENLHFDLTRCFSLGPGRPFS